MTQTPIVQAAIRPHLIKGADRELMIFTTILCVGMGLSFMSVAGFIGSFILWAIIVALLQQMGKADPLMRAVYQRQMQYHGYYPARADIDASPVRFPKKWH